ncbi:hypothetical protein BDK51DRAFT_34779 [Blyttiomyces helicus]|uniref:Uncharacterized protein n=1 Tax=Blyttiomyces helicus TaxID=388810 RepID=A0A4P9W336_9FUNG|nr:hypothetical protein BDK51DRAFT_34779 [Blyttiomyces helicus]|eukprot:RKO85030.1 hypothetical protein BDK51DRAFT_34779 [Blyttiomyces helicus]
MWRWNMILVRSSFFDQQNRDRSALSKGLGSLPRSVRTARSRMFNCMVGGAACARSDDVRIVMLNDGPSSTTISPGPSVSLSNTPRAPGNAELQAKISHRHINSKSHPTTHPKFEKRSQKVNRATTRHFGSLLRRDQYAGETVSGVSSQCKRRRGQAKMEGGNKENKAVERSEQMLQKDKSEMRRTAEKGRRGPVSGRMVIGYIPLEDIPQVKSERVG